MVCSDLLTMVEPGGKVHSDDHLAYRHIDKMPCTHQSVKHSAKELARKSVHMTGIKSVWALLKRAYKGVYPHCSVKHCHRYINEPTFRLNKGGAQVGK